MEAGSPKLPPVTGASETEGFKASADQAVPTGGPAAASRPTPRQEHGGLRGLIELSVLLLLMVLLVRTFLAEAYLVPTGSMALSLAGHHKAVACPQCGFRTLVGHRGAGDAASPAEDHREAERNYRLAWCPNCGWDRLDLHQVDECVGDRLLVHKNIFDIRSPRRWELVVFRNPDANAASPSDTMIKRLVGLPGERIQIRDGDVWINDAIQRKTLAEMREHRVLVFDNDYLPRDAASPFRWTPARGSGWQVEHAGRGFRLPPRRDHKVIDWLSYRHLTRIEGAGGKTSWKETSLAEDLSYNAGQNQAIAIHDLILECLFEPTGSGVLSLAITDGFSDILVELPVDDSSLPAAVREASAGQMGPAGGYRNPQNKRDRSANKALASTRFTLKSGRQYRLELALVDRRLMVALDGREPFGPVDLPDPASKMREPLRRALALGGAGPIAIGGVGIGLEVGKLRVYRDLHYTEGDGQRTFPHAIGTPAVLGPGEYFVLGDNSASSYDSRCWKCGPKVRHEHLIGKAFLVHLPSRTGGFDALNRHWTYFTPDWERMKWLR